MKKRGGYPLNLKHQIKVRVSPETLSKLQQLSEARKITLARLMRDFIAMSLRSNQA
jgi:hypothetical protein